MQFSKSEFRGEPAECFTTETWLAHPIEKVFEFFSSEKNLEILTPDFLQFRVLGMNTPQIQEGTLIDYRLKIHGIPVRWQTRIEEWKPGHHFVDTQLKGPYSLWHHRHEFTAENGGTRMRDRVMFRLPLGGLGMLVAGAFVRKDVRQIFEYRERKLAELFPR